LPQNGGNTVAGSGTSKGSGTRKGSAPAKGPSPLDPQLRERLLAEARSPWRGLRRALWFALFASAAVGMATMSMRGAAGAEVGSTDWLVQVVALVVCGGLLWFDRDRRPRVG
jgi:hypothetical protein